MRKRRRYLGSWMLPSGTSADVAITPFRATLVGPTAPTGEAPPALEHSHCPGRQSWPCSVMICRVVPERWCWPCHEAGRER